MGSSNPVRKLVRHVEKVSPTRFTVLIEGESGTGKELVARAIHDLSEVRNGPFVAVDCGAIPAALMESELFGYMKGAFTGAYGDKPGHFELADAGTLFLDEVGNIAYPVQQKLLRAIQERVIQRLGAKAPLPINVRIVAATNQSLKKDVESGIFRSDLYFRLNEFSVKMPALRERIEDIHYLAGRFMDEVEKELNKAVNGFSKDALVSLSSYHWPGNVRELRNVIRQAVLLCDKNAPVQPVHLTYHSHVSTATETVGLMTSETVYDGSSSLKELVQLHMNDLETRLIRDALAKARGNKSEAARNLGVDYKTLLRKIKSLGIAFP
jgi:transcriptional regulator with PAS, ATPase and Fis domain